VRSRIGPLALRPVPERQRSPWPRLWYSERIEHMQSERGGFGAEQASRVVVERCVLPGVDPAHRGFGGGGEEIREAAGLAGECVGMDGDPLAGTVTLAASAAPEPVRLGEVRTRGGRLT
jgi:hypothetical protein